MAAFPWYWTRKEHDRWATTRSRGMYRYVVGQGLLGWGLIMFLVMACAPAFFGVPWHVDPSTYYWVRQTLLWAAAGVAYGLTTWYTYEWMYRKYAEFAP